MAFPYAAVFLRPYVVKERLYSIDLTDKELKQRTRLTRYQYNLLLDKIGDQLQSNSHSSIAVDPDTKLLTVLQYLATGEFQWSVAEKCGISQTSECKFMGQVVEAINLLKPQLISMPNTPQEMEAKADRFLEVFNFPEIIGCVDGTLVPIETPTHGEAAFVDRKGRHSINCQVICDADMKIMDVVAQWPGSVHDSFMFRSSGVCERFENGEFGQYKLLGDTGYRLTDYLLKLYLEEETEAQEQFNFLHRHTRCIVEMCFGLLKGRWLCLNHRKGGEILYSPEKACRIFLACCILHNLCFLSEGDQLLQPNEDDFDMGVVEDDNDDGVRMDVPEEDDNQVEVVDVASLNARDAFVARHAVFRQ